MKSNNSAIVPEITVVSTPGAAAGIASGTAAGPGSISRAGLIWGSLGVLAFSFTLPLTRIAVGEFDPLFVATGRAVVAAVLAAIVLLWTRSAIPSARQWGRLVIVSLGVVAGFPLLTSFALQEAPASHGAVVVGLLPATTAVFAVLRAKERPGRRFWIAAAAGVICVLAFVGTSNGGLDGFHRSDLLLMGAIVLVAIGYAEGGLLSREIGSWQTISWALLLALPVMVPLAVVSLAAMAARSGTGFWPSAGAEVWASFAYLGVISMFLGFFAWYRGLAIGPMAQVSQIQLGQPVLTIAWSVLLLGESITWPTVIAAVAVVACAAIAVRSRSVASRGHKDKIRRSPASTSPIR
jgi:drug/metabolite transporter (DMT)-like permease